MYKYLIIECKKHEQQDDSMIISLFSEFVDFTHVKTTDHQIILYYEQNIDISFKDVILNVMSDTLTDLRLYASYHYPLGPLYATFYYLPILGSMIILNKKWGAETDINQKAVTRLFFFGYLFTFMPAMILAIFIPSFLTAVESLLCKLAFVFATFLTIFVLKNKTIIK